MDIQWICTVTLLSHLMSLFIHYNFVHPYLDFILSCECQHGWHSRGCRRSLKREGQECTEGSLTGQFNIYNLSVENGPRSILLSFTVRLANMITSQIDSNNDDADELEKTPKLTLREQRYLWNLMRVDEDCDATGRLQADSRQIRNRWDIPSSSLHRLHKRMEKRGYV